MVVELKIKKKNPWAGLIKYKSCFDYIAPYFTRSGSIYTGLTPEDEKKYEKALGLPDGELSKSSDFWKTFCVKIGSRSLILDDQYPRQEMIIKFLTGHKRVATSLDKLSMSIALSMYIVIQGELQAILLIVRLKLFSRIHSISSVEMRLENLTNLHSIRCVNACDCLESSLITSLTNS
mgnify:CR=1 FL=1